MSILTEIQVSKEMQPQFAQAEEIAIANDLSEREKHLYVHSILETALKQPTTTKNNKILQTALTQSKNQLVALSKKDSYYQSTLAELTQKPATLTIQKLLNAFSQWIAITLKKKNSLSA